MHAMVPKYSSYNLPEITDEIEPEKTPPKKVTKSAPSSGMTREQLLEI